jgi:hypothetical protein
MKHFFNCFLKGLWGTDGGEGRMGLGIIEVDRLAIITC